MADQTLLKLKGKKHHKDDLKTQLKYQALQRQTMRLMPILLRTEEKLLCQKMTNALRRFLPKTFFAAAKTFMKDLKRGQQALGFKAQEVDGILKEQECIKDYIEGLYSDVTDLHERVEINQGEQLTISQEELAAARGKLASDKASGVDQLVDHWLKNDEIWTEIKD